MVDLYPEFQEKTAEGKELYFRTDHHFNTLGAYTAYSKLAEKMGISPYPEQDFQKTEVTDSFLGTMYSKSGFRFLPPDTMERWDLSEEEKYTLYTADDDTTREGLYFEENLLVKDKYTYFLGGNHALQVIKKNTPGEKVLLIKDSYAHIAAPFIARHFSETHLLDLRYFKKNVSNYIAEEKIDRVIVMYSLSEFLESINFGTLK